MDPNVIQLSYELALEDIHAFNEHYGRGSKLTQNSRRTARWALTGILGLLLLTLGLWIHAPLGFWLLGVLILAGWFSVFPSRLDQMLRRHTARLYQGNEDLLGPHTLVLEAEWVEERSTLRKVRTHWRAVKKVVVTASHLFVYVTGFSAVIVPRRAFSDDASWERFVQQAQEGFNRHR